MIFHSSSRLIQVAHDLHLTLDVLEKELALQLQPHILALVAEKYPDDK